MFRICLLASCAVSWGCSALVTEGTAPSPDAGPAALLDSSGDYSCTLVANENDCVFTNWVEGSISTDVPLTLEQSDEVVIAVADGWLGESFDAMVGTNALAGTIDGGELELAVVGLVVGAPETNCSYTVNLGVSAELDGDTLGGELSLHRTYTEGSEAACPAPEGCASRLGLVCTRPPR